MKIFFDTEFYENGKTIELISIGMVREDGATLYFETSEAPELCAQDIWLMKNVFPHLRQTWTQKAVIRSAIVNFVGDKPEFWAYCADYDWIVLCQLFGRMIDLPATWPMFCMDIKQLAVMKGDPELPKQKSVEHNALNDAMWNKQCWEFLNKLAG